MAKQEKCCHKVAFTYPDNTGADNNPTGFDDDPDPKNPVFFGVIRLDLMRWVQCGNVKGAINNGDGRYHIHRDEPWDVPLSADDLEGNFMADVTPSATGLLRRMVGQNGYNEVCLLPEALDLSCKTLSPQSVSSEAQNDAVQRSRQGVNTCHIPGSWADGENTRIEPDQISPCDVVALFGMQSRLYTNATSFGFTDEDYARCNPESVPNIVEAFYRFQFPGVQQESAPNILMWWAKNRPTFYHGAVRTPSPPFALDLAGMKRWF
ncbi:MAG: hypothetical protein ACPGR8_15265 [Limisphaerales bacterium]